MEDRYAEAHAAGRRVGAVRKASGLTARELAERAGVSAGSLRLLESGGHNHVSDERLARLGDVLGVSVQQLRGLDPLPDEGEVRYQRGFSDGYEAALRDRGPLANHTRDADESPDSANASLATAA